MSYARVGIFRFKPGTSDEMMRTTQENAFAMLSRLPGFIFYHAVRTGEGRAVSISSWETEAQAKEAVRMMDEWIDRSVPSLLTESDVFVGEVSVEEAAPVGLPSQRKADFVPEARH